MKKISNYIHSKKNSTNHHKNNKHHNNNKNNKHHNNNKNNINNTHNTLYPINNTSDTLYPINNTSDTLYPINNTSDILYTISNNTNKKQSNNDNKPINICKYFHPFLCFLSEKENSKNNIDKIQSYNNFSNEYINTYTLDLLDKTYEYFNIPINKSNSFLSNIVEQHQKSKNSIFVVYFFIFLLIVIILYEIKNN